MSPRPPRILMLTESAYPNDTRVRYEADALSKAGYKVSVIALRRYKDEKLVDELNHVNIYRIPEVTLFKKSVASKAWLRVLLYRIKSAMGYMVEYFYFTLACLFVSIYLAFKDGFDAIHLHNPPNTLFVIGVLFRPFGIKFVFDHHDLEPELYLSRYGIKKNFLYAILLLEEKLCLRFADIVIATNESFKEIDIQRGKKSPDKIFVVRNGPDLQIFRPVPKDRELLSLGKNILIYVGVMGPQDGVEYLLRAVRELVCEMGRTDFYCVLVGRGDAVESLKVLRDTLGLQNYVRFTGRIPHSEVPSYISTADICLDPNPASPCNNYSTTIKVMEYMALGKPIICFDLKETRYSAQDAAVYVTPNDEKEFARAIVRLMKNPRKRARMGAFGRKRVSDELAWQHVSKNLLLAYESILPKPVKELDRHEERDVKPVVLAKG